MLATSCPNCAARHLPRTAVEWEEIFGERVPCTAVRPIEDMFGHPQVIAEALVTTLESGGRLLPDDDGPAGFVSAVGHRRKGA
jgi:hypothetical protein